jgi:hypothetical protein
MAATIALISAVLKLVSEAIDEVLVRPFTLKIKFVKIEFVTVGPGVGKRVGEPEGNGVGLPGRKVGANVGSEEGESVGDAVG